MNGTRAMPAAYPARGGRCVRYSLGMGETPTETAGGKRGERPWRDLHLWQIQPVRDVLFVVGVLGLLWLGSTISLVTVPLLLAVLLAYLFEPVVRVLVRQTRASRPVATGIILVAFALLVVIPAAGAVTFGLVQGVGLVSRQVGHVQILQRSLVARDEAEAGVRRAQLEDEAGPAWVWIYDRLAEIDDETINAAIETISTWTQTNLERIVTTAADVGVNAAASALALVGSLFTLGLMAFLTAFFFYFVSSGWPKVLVFGDSLVPDKHRATVTRLVGRFDRVISAFIRGRLTIAFIQAILFTAGYWVIGVPAPLILGPAVAVLAIVPYLALVGVPVSIGLLFLESHDGVRGALWFVLLAPTAVYFIVQSLDDYVLTPVIQGKTTDMSTPLILFAALAGGVLFGFFGLLVAIPIAACLKIVVLELYWPKYKAWAEGRRSDALPLDGD